MVTKQYEKLPTIYKRLILAKNHMVTKPNMLE